MAFNRHLPYNGTKSFAAADLLERLESGYIALGSKWRIDYVNRAAEAIIGRTRLDLVGRSVWEILTHFADSTIDLSLQLAMLEKRPIRFAARPFGENREMEFQAYPDGEGMALFVKHREQRLEDRSWVIPFRYYKDDSASPFVSPYVSKMVSDQGVNANVTATSPIGITDQQASRKRERRLRAIFNQEFQYMAVLAVDGTILEINDLLEAVGGDCPYSLEGRPIWEVALWSHLPNADLIWADRLLRAASSNSRVLVEDEHHDAQGERHVTSTALNASRGEDGLVEFFILQGVDITQSKQDEEDRVRAYETTIDGWTRALDARDHETEGHSRRVAGTAVRLAKRLDYPEEEIVHLRRGAVLHDIGKLGVPDGVLQKPGPLTAPERAIMQRHPQIAYDMLSPIRFLEPALDIPYAHHERWDGAGYPRGLKGEEIPWSARIFAVVDVFDALTSDRIYRTAWSLSEAIEYIESESGKHFDPVVVGEFINMLLEDYSGE